MGAGAGHFGVVRVVTPEYGAAQLECITQLTKRSGAEAKRPASVLSVIRRQLDSDDTHRAKTPWLMQASRTCEKSKGVWGWPIQIDVDAPELYGIRFHKGGDHQVGEAKWQRLSRARDASECDQGQSDQVYRALILGAGAISEVVYPERGAIRVGKRKTH